VEPAVFRVKSSIVLVPTLVTNKSGKIIHGLKPENFIVLVDGKEQPFHLSESPDSEKISIIVAVQVGGSAYLLFEDSRKNQWEFDSTFVNLTNQFRNTYLISFQPPDTAPGFHNIQIRLRNAPKNAIVRFRSGYRKYPD